MIRQSNFGDIAKKATSLFELSTAKEGSLKLGLSNYGARITYLIYPDKYGNNADLVCGFDRAEKYLQDRSFHGCVVGRVTNRIANAAYTLDGKKISVTANHGKHCLHGGSGFHSKIWDYELGDNLVKFTHVSPDGEDGFAGELTASVTYILKDSNTLSIIYEAKSTKATLCNLTQHSYFNLNGVGKNKIYDHVLQIRSKQITETDDQVITTGRFLNVEGTKFDFRRPTKLGDVMKDGQVDFDDNYCLDPDVGMNSAAIVLQDSASGRSMSISTSQPGVQLYTGNFLDGSSIGHGGSYGKHSALCLETQHFPGAEMYPHFPSIFLGSGQYYQHKTDFTFSCK